MPLLLLCADARSQAGTRRVARCLALAAAWQDAGGRAALVAHDANPSNRQRIQRTAIRWFPIHGDSPIRPAIVQALDELGCGTSPRPWVVLDGEPFMDHVHTIGAELGCRLLIIDERGRPTAWPADAILNPNLESLEWAYPVDGRALQLLGPGYVPLGPEFASWQTWRRVTAPVARRALISRGSLDVLQATGQVSIPGLETRVASPDHVPDQMAWADVAVTLGTATCWESAFMQLPTLILLGADRELALVRDLERARVVESLGWAGHVTAASIARSLADFCCDPRSRRLQSMEGRRMVDGQGARRVVGLMRALEGPLPHDQLVLRPANMGDVAALWRLSNEQSILRTALDDRPCSLEQFGSWFEQRVAGGESRSWVIDLHGCILAHVRYDRRSGDRAEIAIAVHAGFRRRGLAMRLLKRTGRVACQELRVGRLRAVVREENAASQSLFRKAGFTATGYRMVSDKPCRIYEM